MCGKGVYVWVLVCDIVVNLGIFGYVIVLLRICVGFFDVFVLIVLENFLEICYKGEFNVYLKLVLILLDDILVFVVSGL